MKGAHLIILLNSVSVHASNPVSNWFACLIILCSHDSHVTWFFFSAPCGSIMTMTFSETSLSLSLFLSLYCPSFLSLFFVPLFSRFFKIHFTRTATAWRYVARSRRSHTSQPSPRQLHRTTTNVKQICLWSKSKLRRYKTRQQNTRLLHRKSGRCASGVKPPHSTVIRHEISWDCKFHCNLSSLMV